MRSPIMAVSNTPFLNGEFPKFDFTAFTDFGKFAEQWEKFDFAKVADKIKLPGFDAQALVAYQKLTLEPLASANKIDLEGDQAVIRRHSEIVRKSVADASKALSELRSEEHTAELQSIMR